MACQAEPCVNERIPSELSVGLKCKSRSYLQDALQCNLQWILVLGICEIGSTRGLCLLQIGGLLLPPFQCPKCKCLELSRAMEDPSKVICSPTLVAHQLSRSQDMIMTSSASSTVVASGSGSFRNSTGARLSFMDGSTHRLSIGSNRLSLLPGGKNNITPPVLPTPQFDGDELSARASTFTNDVNIAIQKIKTKIAENTEQWVQDTAEARGTCQHGSR